MDSLCTNFELLYYLNFVVSANATYKGAKCVDLATLT